MSREQNNEMQCISPTLRRIVVIVVAVNSVAPASTLKKSVWPDVAISRLESYPSGMGAAKSYLSLGSVLGRGERERRDEHEEA